jgi:hypothetical protein
VKSQTEMRVGRVMRSRRREEAEGACGWDEHDNCEVRGCEGGCETPFEKYAPAVF